jgi:hypothetical protein
MEVANNRKKNFFISIILKKSCPGVGIDEPFLEKVAKIRIDEKV